MIASYSEKIGQLIQKLTEKAEKSNSDVYTQFVAYLEEKGCLGTRSIDTTEASGLQVTHKSSLSDLQARHAFLDTQDPEALAVGKPSYELPCIMEALARCGDKKYSTIMEMSFASRVRSMVQNVLGQATEMEVITEAVASEASEGAADFDEKVGRRSARTGRCWRNMTFKDLHGFPLWETQLHDVLQGAFPELQSIFRTTAARLSRSSYRQRDQGWPDGDAYDREGHRPLHQGVQGRRAHSHTRRRTPRLPSRHLARRIGTR